MTHASAPSELLAINERLLIAGLREQELALTLRRQLAFTNAITNSLGEGVCALDSQGLVTFINPAGSQMLGVPVEDLLHRSFHECVHVDCGEDCPLLAAIRAETPFQNDDDVFMSQVKEAMLPVAYTTAPIEMGDNQAGVVIAFRDVTERKRLLLQEQVARVNAEAALKMRSETLQMVVHDLRTPLTSIKGYAQYIARELTSKRSDHVDHLVVGLGHIDAGVMRMMAALNELLDVAQLQEGRTLALHRSSIDLVGLVQKVKDGQQEATEHVLTVESAEQSLVGDWDGYRLERVIGNLLSNAIKYSATESQIVMRLSRDEVAVTGRWAVLEISDTGIGIPAADLSRIFERFHRGSNVAGRFFGTGLGLSGSKAIIEQHSGTIDIQSAEGVGTSVTIRLPLASGGIFES